LSECALQKAAFCPLAPYYNTTGAEKRERISIEQYKAKIE